MLRFFASTIEIGPEDRCRVGGTLGLTSAAIASTFALAVGSGMPVNNPAAVGSVIALAAVTGALGASTVSSSAVAPLPLFREDARELTRVESALELFNANDVSTFYRSSTIVGLLVGAAFAFSPVSPIAVFDEELPVTHMMRQDVGVYIMALLCPVQAALFRAAKRGNLAEPSTRALNTATGLAIAALVFDGRAQVIARWLPSACSLWPLTCPLWPLACPLWPITCPLMAIGLPSSRPSAGRRMAV